MSLYTAQARGEDTAGHHIMYPCFVRTESHKAAALYFIRRDDQCCEDDLTIMQIPPIDGPEGFADEGGPGDGWREEKFSTEALRGVLEIQP